MPHRLLPHLYETIAQGAMFGIAVFENSNSLIYANGAAHQLFGTNDIKIEMLVPRQGHSHFKSFRLDFLSNDGFYQDILISRVDHTTFIANVWVRFIQVDGVSAHLLMFQDITLQKKLQREIIAKQNEIKAAFEELLKQNRQLKELDIAKDRFIALTTHELRTPLSAMVASAEILKLGIYDNEEQMREFIDIIYDQGLHLQDLVNDILDFAKIQAGKMDFYIENEDVIPLVKSIVKNFEGMAETNAVTLHLQTAAGAVLCYFDEVRLRQVLSNVVNNAIKYNHRGGEVRVTFSETSHVVRISVTDTGPGIPKAHFDKVFNEFETVGQVAQHHKGTGLGMPISRKLTEGMGGRLELDSQVGVGSTFWVELPKEKILDESLYRPRPEKSVA